MRRDAPAGELTMRGKDRERELSLEECPADDRPFAAQLLHGCEIGRRADASGCEHGQARPGLNPRKQVEIRPGEGSIAVDGGAKETRDAGSRAPFCRLLCGHVGVPAPPANDQTARTDVDRRDEPAVQRVSEALESVWGREGCRPDHDPGGARVEQPLSVARRAHSSGGLDTRRRRRSYEPANELRAWPTRAGTVQIDDVDQPCACCDEPFDERRRIGFSHDDAVEFAALEPHCPLSEDVDCGYYLKHSLMLVC
jgi:hypothetical protein